MTFKRYHVFGLGLFAVITFQVQPALSEEPNQIDFSERSKSISLSEVLSRALSKNAKLAAVRSEVKASRASVNADEPILPSPIVTAGSMGNSGPFQKRLESSLTVSQTIPFPTKSFSKRNALSYESDAREATAESFELQLKSDVTRTFFEYLAATKQLELLGELKQIYHHHLKRLHAGAAQDQLMKSHILSAQSELSALENEYQDALASQEAIRGELNVLMGENPLASLGPPEELPISNFPTPLNEEDLKSALERYPDRRELDSRLKATQSMQTSARSTWLPDLMVSYRYNKRHDLMPDEQELMVGVSLPFLTFWQPKAENERATARLVSARAEQLQQDRELQLRYLKLRANLGSLHSQLENLEKNIVPAAQQRVKIVMSLSPTDMSSLIEHREALEKYVKFKMELITKRTEYESAIAWLQNLAAQVDSKAEESK